MLAVAHMFETVAMILLPLEVQDCHSHAYIPTYAYKRQTKRKVQVACAHAHHLNVLAASSAAPAQTSFETK